MLLHLFVVYDPWGKPGGGAPLKTNSGKVVVEVFGNFENKKKEVKEKCKITVILLLSVSPSL